MKKIALAALASVAAFASVPASAQNVNGTVNITGNVQARCSVIASGVESAAFEGTLALGQLDQADGTLKTGYTNSSTVGPANGQKVLARVVCTGANPNLTLAADKLTNGGAEAVTGYSNIIDYTASLKVTKTDNSVTDVLFNTKTASAPVTQSLTGRIKGGADSNVEVSVFGLNAKNGATSVLEAGNYTGQVRVTIQPSA